MAPLPTISPLPSPTTLSLSKSKVSSIPQWILLLLFLSPSSSADISYDDHCASVVPSSNPTTDSDALFDLSDGYFSGGDRLLGQATAAKFTIPRSFAFHTRSVHRTETRGTLQLAGTLIFRGGGVQFAYGNLTVRGRSLRLVRPWRPRSFNPRGRFSFDLSGFWSEGTGKLCMVGSGTGRSKEGTFLHLSAVFKLKYPSSSNITSSVVSGNLESLDSVGSANYFDPIRVLSYSQKKYEYTKLSEARNSCPALDNSGHESVGFLDKHQTICNVSSYFWWTRLKLNHGSGCTTRKCGPLSYSLGLQPDFLRFTSSECAADGNFRAVFMFFNHSDLSYSMVLEPGVAMVAEGSWDQAKNQLCLLACRVNNVRDALADNAVDDCTIGLSLAFPAFLTIESRSTIVGQIWSNLKGTDPGYFDNNLFQSVGYNNEPGHGLRYKYTMIDAVRKRCIEGDARKPGKKRYPNPWNYRDLMFYLRIKTTEGKLGSGFANPIALDETIYDDPSLDLSALMQENKSIWNISYRLTQDYHQFAPFNFPESDVAAEGIYNGKTGMICMVGCRSSSYGKKEKNEDSKDCSILINIQIPTLNPELGEHLNGTIRSTRAKKDPLFFEPLQISSQIMYSAQASQSIWRMDLEIIIGLTSLTFSGIFVGLQLFHTNKHPEVRPSISITMLIILTLGYMIHLVLNFESFSRNHNRENILQSNEGWLEVNEVVMRLMTMSVFLLHFRLLQVAWSSRSTYEGKNSLWLAERRTIQLCLTICIAGGFIAWVVPLRPHKTLHHVPHVINETKHSYLEDVQSYAGLILDGFLFPQLTFNVFCNSIGRSLAPPFYIGTSIIRALPHVYDAYRSTHYVPYFISSNIYARKNGDLYSLAWDIIIPCGGLLFAAVIYIQQRFGGASIFFRRIKSPGAYEMVPIATS